MCRQRLRVGGATWISLAGVLLGPGALVGATARAEEEAVPAAEVEAPPEGPGGVREGPSAGGVTVTAVVVKSAPPASPSAGRQSIVHANLPGEPRRVLFVEGTLYVGVREAEEQSPTTARRVRSYLAGSELQYVRWAHEVDVAPGEVVSTGTLELAMFTSELVLSAPQTATAGEDLALTLTSTGEADSEWRVSLAYPGDGLTLGEGHEPRPDAARYDERRVTAGMSKGAQGTSTTTVAFQTYKADSGRLLGLLVENAADPRASGTVWVSLK